MGYELAEQMDWQLPDAIFYPTGGGVGLIGMWKAFDEMEALGWIGAKRPKMIAVQVEGCQPVVRAFEQGTARSEFWENAHTVASGLRVPKPLGDFLILNAVRESGGTAIAVSDAELLDAGIQLASDEGLFIAPEGAACVSALEKLLAERLSQTRREDRHLQYGRRTEISGSVFHALSAIGFGRAGQAGRTDHTTMKQIARNALDAAVRRGISYGDVRVIETEERQVSTKNGKIGNVSSFGFPGSGHSRARSWLLGIRRDRRSDRGRYRSRGRAGRRDRACQRHWRRNTTSCSRPRRSTRPSGSRPSASILFHPGRPESGAAVLPSTRSCGATRRHAGRGLNGVHAAPPDFRLIDRQPDRSDALHQRRGIRGTQFSRRRDSEALVSEFVRRPTPVEGL